MTLACVAGALSFCPPAAGQTDVASQEAKRRSQLADDAGALLADADKLAADGKLAEATAKYLTAVNSLPPGASAVTLQRVTAVKRYSDTATRHAEALAARGDYAKANQLLDTVLADNMSPGHKAAATLKKNLKDPDRFNPAMSPAHADNVQKVNDLLTLANGHVALGKFDEAKAAFNQVLLVDSTSTAARRGLEMVESMISDHLEASRDYTREKMLQEVDRAWETAVPFQARMPATDGAGPAMTDAATTTSKLRTIVLPRLATEQSTIREILVYVARRSIDLDVTEPDENKRGVNVIFNPGGKKDADFPLVTLDLRNVALADAFRSIADLTETSWRIEGTSVVFSPAGDAAGQMQYRTFRTPPGLLSSSAGTATEAGATDPFADGGGDAEKPKFKVLDAKTFLVEHGVPFPEGATADYSKGLNMLTVRNTADNLDRIEDLLLQLSDSTGKMVLVQVTTLDCSETTLKELASDLLLDQFNVGGNGVFAGGGTFGSTAELARGNGANFGIPNPAASAAAGAVVPIGYHPVTAGLRGSPELFRKPDIDYLINAGSAAATVSTNKGPGIFSLAGAFTDPQWQMVLRALNQKKGVDLAVSSTILLKSGQRSSSFSGREMLYPTEYDPPQIPQTFDNGGGGVILFDPTTGLFSLANQDPTPGFPVTPATPQSFESKKLGNELEVEANIGADNYTIDLNLAATFTEFDGFINYGEPITTVSGPTRVELTKNQILQPIFRLLRESTQVSVYSGSTIAIGGLKTERVQRINDAVPLFSQIPFIGSAMKSSVTQSQKRAVVYFVTAKVVDPADVTEIKDLDKPVTARPFPAN